MKKTILSFLILFGFGITGVLNLSAQSQACNQICDFYTGCVETKKKLSSDEKKKVAAGCMNT